MSKRPMRCEDASIGNICWAWNSPMRASMPRSSPNARARLIEHHARSAPAGENAHDFRTKRLVEGTRKTAHQFTQGAGKNRPLNRLLSIVGNDACRAQ